MNREKWTKLRSESVRNAGNILENMDFTPEGWPKEKAAYMEYIEELDELTEVFNLENKVK
jgi:hypothetical protein